MHAVLVMRQLTGVLDHLLWTVTYRHRLTPHEVQRQSVQRSLEQLAQRGITDPFRSCVRDRTGGWGLTDRGRELWNAVELDLLEQDQRLHQSGVLTRPYITSLESLTARLMGATHAMQMSRLGLYEPPTSPGPPEWEL